VGEIHAPRLVVLLVHREIDDPGEGEAALVDEAQLAPDLVARAARDALEFLRLAATKNTASPLCRCSCWRIASVRSGPMFLASGPAPSSAPPSPSRQKI
jgi:hypothetical protein